MRAPLERSVAAAISSRGVSDPATAAIASTCRVASSNRSNERVQELADDPAAVGGAHELLDEQRIAAGAGVQRRRRRSGCRIEPGDSAAASWRTASTSSPPRAITRDERRRSSRRGMSGSWSRLVATNAIGASSTARGRCWSTQIAVGSAQCRSSRTTSAGAHAESASASDSRWSHRRTSAGSVEVAERLDAERAVDSAPELHRLPPGPVGLAPQHPHARGPRDRRAFVDETGLADAGLADHQRDAGPARSRGVERGLQERHLAIPADERARECGRRHLVSDSRMARSCQCRRRLTRLAPRRRRGGVAGRSAAARRPRLRCRGRWSPRCVPRRTRVGGGSRWR